MLKKVLISTILGVTLLSTCVSAGERTAQGDDIYNPNNYRTEYDAESQLTLNINEEVLKLYTKAEVLILVSDYLDNRQLPFTTTRINYDLLIEPITTNTYKVILF